jgi:hypothetical protein
MPTGKRDEYNRTVSMSDQWADVGIRVPGRVARRAGKRKDQEHYVAVGAHRAMEDNTRDRQRNGVESLTKSKKYR